MYYILFTKNFLFLFNFIKDKIANYHNFSIRNVNAPELVQIVFQNPETQILSHTIESELAFGLECQTTNSTILQNLLEKLKS